MAGAGPPSPSVHKPRHKTKKASAATVPSLSSSLLTPSSSNNVSPSTEALVRAPSFPLSAFLWPARLSSSRWELLPLILMVAGLFRWAAGLWGYSGFQSPPMFGDFEAQRHWMEVTTQLPVSQWYFHDQQWWGLDYPPLTAYHSWLCGKIGALVEPAWFELYASRGSHDPTLKVFMRATVLVSEYLIYVPAAVVFVRRYGRLASVASWTGSVALAAILMQPATILVDHVHFQYNTVMLGLVLASMSSMLASRYLWAAIFFVAALAFKQMALYYAFPVFTFLLANCVFPRLNPSRFVGIAAATLAAFAVVMLPLLAGTLYDTMHDIDARPDPDGLRQPLPIFPILARYLDTGAVYYPFVEQVIQMLHRIFPFARGLFEDKVANFWCAANLVVKLQRYPPALLQWGALVATLASVAPPNLILFFRPDKKLLPLAFAVSAWGFFLFSYQVHEKSVLIPLMPMTLLLAGRHGLAKDTRAWVGFANLLGCWTMFPLLKRVDLRMPYAVLSLLWAYLLGLPPVSHSAYFQDGGPIPTTSSSGGGGGGAAPSWPTTIAHGGFYLAMVLWHAVEGFMKPPPGKPDLWVVANVVIGAAGFSLCYLWCLWRLVVEADILPRKWTARKGKAKTR